MINKLMVSSCLLLTSLPTYAERVDYQSITKQVLAEKGVENLGVRIDFKEVERQSRFDSKIQYKEALSTALDTFISFGIDEPETPANLVTEDYHHQECSQKDRDDRVKCWLNKGDSSIHIVYRDYNTLSYDVSSRPEWGESVLANWIFHVKMPSLSDHLHWAVIDRSSHKPPYGYSFN